jgi:hypothetical protein
VLIWWRVCLAWQAVCLHGEYCITTIPGQGQTWCRPTAAAVILDVCIVCVCGLRCMCMWVHVTGAAATMAACALSIVHSYAQATCCGPANTILCWNISSAMSFGTVLGKCVARVQCMLQREASVMLKSHITGHQLCGFLLWVHSTGCAALAVPPNSTPRIQQVFLHLLYHTPESTSRFKMYSCILSVKVGCVLLPSTCCCCCCMAVL